MKIFHFTIIMTVSLIMSLFTAASAPAAEPVPSHIKAVTIYTDQALIQREGIVSVGKGTREMTFELEASHVDNDSVSGRVYGEGELVSVKLREIPLKEAPQENVKTIEKKITALKKSIKTAAEEKEVLNKKETFLKSVIACSEKEGSKEMKAGLPKAADLEKTLKFLTGSFSAINTQRQALNAKTEDAEKDIKALEKELAAFRGPRGDFSRKLIDVVFNSAKQQKIKVQTEYLVKNVSWSPLYRVSVPEQMDGINLTMFSGIRQKTGEDWHRVSLAVSNAVPVTGVALPPLSSWNIDVEKSEQKAEAGKSEDSTATAKTDAVPATQKAEAPKADEASSAKTDAASTAPKPEVKKTDGAPPAGLEPEKKEPASTAAQREVSALSFEYKMPQVMSIDSQDKETVLSLYTKKLQSDFFYYTMPRVNPSVFLICSTKADRELLSGPINVFFGDRFVGKTVLGGKKAGDEVLFNLGADSNVKISRELVKDKAEETGFSKSTIVREIAYKMTAENTRDKAVRLKILDSIPVAKNDRVEVKDVKISPDPNEKNYQGREGVIMWETELKPEEKKEITVEFVVSYPKDATVTGL